MNGETVPGRGHLRLVSSQPDESRTPVDRIEASVLRRRYTVTVQADGSELIDEVEEWEEPPRE